MSCMNCTSVLILRLECIVCIVCIVYFISISSPIFQGKSDDIALQSESDTFEQRAVDVLKVQIPPVGTIYKLRVWHDDKGMSYGHAP